MSDINVTFTLTDADLDAVSGGQSSATLTISNLRASGPTSATVSATGVSISASSVGGLEPSQSASLSGTFSSASS